MYLRWLAALLCCIPRPLIILNVDLIRTGKVFAHPIDVLPEPFLSQKGSIAKLAGRLKSIESRER